MKYRTKLTRKRSRKMFSKAGSYTHKKNTLDTVMRGGIRL